MKHARATALVVLAALMFVPMTNTSATEIHDDYVPIMEGPIDVAVYFADNMAFTPQWRMDNFIRIEMIVLDVTGVDDPLDIPMDYWDETYTQDVLRANPELLFETNMVSVSQIWINITSESGVCVESWYSNWDPDVVTEVENTVIREINGEGHLIYGGKWDTSTMGESAEPGFYTVSVGLPGMYNIKWAVQHDRGVDEEPIEDVALLSADPVEPAEPIGYMLVSEGGVYAITDEANEAYIVLGELLDGGGSGVNGGGDDGGNGPAYQGGGLRR